MHRCSNCGCAAKTKKKLKEHELLCKLEMGEVLIKEVEPTNRQMWILIQKLHKQNEILIKKVAELERVVHKDIKKINITEWLKKNDKILVSNTKLKEKYQSIIKYNIIQNIKQELDSNFKYQLTI